MKQFKLQRVTVCLLAAMSLTALIGCQPQRETPDPTATTVSDTETAAPAPKLTLDSTYDIYIPSDADDQMRRAAEHLAAAFREKAGLEMSVVTEGEEGHRYLRLGLASSAEERSYQLGVSDTGFLYLTASDSTTLYFAAEAVAKAWLDPAAGMTKDGKVYLYDTTLDTLNNLSTRLDHSIRVMTQNVRAADDPDGNTVQRRADRFRQLLEEYRPDVFGTQEFTFTWSVALEKRMKDSVKEGLIPTYASVGCSREGRDKKGGEFNSVFYRVDRFELLDSDTVWLSDTPDRVSCVPSSLCNRICTWALLKDKDTGMTILVANTHLDHGLDEVREAQAKILMNYLAERVGDYPVYLTGDFNSYNSDNAYHTVSSVFSDAHKTAWTDVSTVSHTYHGYSEWGGEIDFIFHNDRTTPIYYEIISKQYDGFVSDHYGVIAEFVQ